MLIFLPILAASAASLFFYRRVLRYLRYFQQEEYHGIRFLAWFRRMRAFDRRGSCVCIVACLLTAVVQVIPSISSIVWLLCGLALIITAWIEEDPRSHGKLTLKVTERARRIWWTATGLFTVVCLLKALFFIWFMPVFYHSLYWLVILCLIQATPLFLIAANQLLIPYEKKLQQGFIDEAKAILHKVNPTVIGITGSYGKTSTKTILGTFLETIAPTFWPPRSINTEMGIVREIREKLKPGHRFAIIEMGAYGIGSIRKLCALTPPHGGIITSIGMMHLERFGSTEAICQAKSELAQAIPVGGLLVCNGDYPKARWIADTYPKAKTLLYGLDSTKGPLDCWMSDIVISASGSRFVIHHQHDQEEQRYSGETPLLGKAMLSNLLAAFTAAVALGAHPAALLAAARNLRPPEHRLEITNQAGVVILDDTYNSNPVGFAEALEILKELPGRRKFLITPGMIELGDQQAIENQKIAELAASICQRVIVVGDTNRDDLITGLQNGGLTNDQIHYFAHRELARSYLQTQLQAGDVVLWENDLPDIYEDQPCF